jgi:hypothetical protein
MHLGKEQLDAQMEKEHIFMNNVLNFELKSINVIVRKKAYFSFIPRRYEHIWGDYSHLSNCNRNLSLLVKVGRLELRD